MQIGAKMTYTFISNLAYKIFYIFQVFVKRNIQQLLFYSYIVNIYSSLEKLNLYGSERGANPTLSIVGAESVINALKLNTKLKTPI